MVAFPEPVRLFTAASRSMRGLVMLLRVSRTGAPVFSSAFSICVTVALGFASRRTEIAPATWGAAMEVPLKRAKLLPGTEDVMF